MDEINKKILNQFAIIKKSIGIDNISDYREIQKVQRQYEVAYASLIIKLMKKQLPISARREEMIKMLEEERLLDKLNNYPGLQKLNIPLEISRIPEATCPDCNSPLTLSLHSNIIECHNCGEDVMFINPHISSTTNSFSNFKPARHFNSWMDHILGKEDNNSNINAELLNKIRIIAKKKCLIIEFMVVDDIRDIVKDLGLSSLNKNASSILRAITNESIPTISDESRQTTLSIFIQVMEVRESIKSRTNRIYYPFYIYKIFEIVLKPEERRILKYIHLHSHGTLGDNDSEWFNICLRVPFLNGKYKPTYRSSQHRCK